MAHVSLGAIVQLHYVGKLEDGTIFDSTAARGPTKIKVGAGGLPEAFEHYLLGMRQGERKSFLLECEEAFGPRDPGLVRQVPRSEIDGNRGPAVGDRLRAETPDGGESHLLVVAVEEDTITVDGNHPLAGKDLSFDVEIVAIVSEGPRS